MNRAGVRLCQPCSCSYLGPELSPGKDRFSFRIHVSILSPHRAVVPVLWGGKTLFLVPKPNILNCERIQWTLRVTVCFYRVRIRPFLRWSHSPLTSTVVMIFTSLPYEYPTWLIVLASIICMVWIAAKTTSESLHVNCIDLILFPFALFVHFCGHINGK